MIASPTRSVRATIAGLAALAVITAGCAAEPVTDDDTDTPASAPGIDEPDGADDDAADSAPTSSSPTPADSTTRPPIPDAPTESTEPATEPVAKPAAEPTAKPAAEPAAKPTARPAVIADGSHAGRLVAITTADVTVKLVRILTGEEAIAAAKADGGAGLDDDGTLPNDIYIQDLDRVVTIPVTGDGGFRIYDCAGGCQIVGTTLTALASGEAVPYGGPNAVVNLTVDQGVVVSFEEQYLP